MILNFKHLITACLLSLTLPGNGVVFAADQAGSENPPASLPNLIGLGAEAVKAYLGAPDFRRTENGAQDWHYNKDGCVLHVFLVPAKAGKAADKMGGKTAEVAYVDAFPANPENAAVVSDDERRRCLARFLDHPLEAGHP